jgi:putative transposase
MARKLRLEFPGACYHVLNRGNYRADVFQSEKTRAAFVACLFEACTKSNWVLHAFVVMRNHYHLALETPDGNLVAGMQWLQATFANRFNRLRGERGHLFQGRYKSLLVEEGEALGQVCHYLHLNPVRAGIVTAERLEEYRASSYWYLRRARPKCLSLTTALVEAGELADTPAGWRSYANYLWWQAEAGPEERIKAYASLSRGWALGSREFKAALVKEHQLAAHARAWESVGAKEVRALQWETALRRALHAVQQSEVTAAATKKSADWKLAVATWMKAHTQASNSWLGQKLHMGTPAAISRNLTRYRREKREKDPCWESLRSISAT